MEFRELNYLITIAEERSISKAAEKLFMAQSSLEPIPPEYGGGAWRKAVHPHLHRRPPHSGREIMLGGPGKMLVDYRQVRDIIQDMEELKAGQVEFGISTFRAATCCRGSAQLQAPVSPDSCGNHGSQQHGSGAAADRRPAGPGPGGAAVSKLKSDVRLLMKDELVITAEADHPGAGVRQGDGAKRLTVLYVELEDTIQFDYILSDYDTIMGAMARRILQARSGPRVVNETRRPLPQPWPCPGWGCPSPRLLPRAVKGSALPLHRERGVFWTWPGLPRPATTGPKRPWHWSQLIRC